MPLIARYASAARQRPGTVYEAVVVGSGPAGITAIGNLLEQRLEPILWVDPLFDGGRINEYYREVPSNTIVKLFIDFALACTPFRKIVQGTPSRDRWEEPSPSDGVSVHDTASDKTDKLQALRQIDQNTSCQLSYAGDVCRMLTEGLLRAPGVISHRGIVSASRLDESSSSWSVQLQENPDLQIKAKRLILCTGSHPASHPLPVEPAGLRPLDLDVVLSPTRLAEALSQVHGPATVAVIGASHSAILVLMNLSQLAQSTHPDLRIKWFTRHPLRYAEYLDGFIALDNTGLKGKAATWAKENLEPATLPLSPVHGFLHKIAYAKGDEHAVYAEHLPGCNFVVQAVGYQRNDIPTLTSAQTGAPIDPVFDHDTGVFYFRGEKGKVVPGLFGIGIGFPERVTDRKYGHYEMNVGFGKFMKAGKKWVETWR